jgi:predicted RNA-binding Zn-ribbon protein involved in translation (DUF1610 family)
VKWRCAWCGREYDAEVDPCDTCGHERVEQVPEDSASPFDADAFVWVCTNCGREHVKRSPPCVRCGNHDLERRGATDVDPGELSIPSYLAVGKPYILGVIAVVALVALALTGVIPIPGLSGPPAPPDAPGDADRSAGVELAAVESELYDRFEAARTDAGSTGRERDAGLDAYAEYATRHHVAERYDPSYDGSVPELDTFDPRCTVSPAFGIAEPSVDLSEHDDAAAADTLAEALLGDERFAELVIDDRRSEGIDVHAGPNGTVFVGYIAC